MKNIVRWWKIRMIKGKLFELDYQKTFFEISTEYWLRQTEHYEKKLEKLCNQQ